MRKLAVVLGVALLAACGSSGSKAAAPSSETSASTTTRPVSYCPAMKQAAIAAGAAFYATSNKYPKTFNELVDAEPPTLMLPDESSSPGISSELISPHTVESDAGWTLTMTADGTRAPTFECS